MSYGFEKITASWLSYLITYSTIASDIKDYGKKLDTDYGLERQ